MSLTSSDSGMTYTRIWWNSKRSQRKKTAGKWRGKGKYYATSAQTECKGRPVCLQCYKLMQVVAKDRVGQFTPCTVISLQMSTLEKTCISFRHIEIWLTPSWTSKRKPLDWLGIYLLQWRKRLQEAIKFPLPGSLQYPLPLGKAAPMLGNSGPTNFLGNIYSLLQWWWWGKKPVRMERSGSASLCW